MESLFNLGNLYFDIISIIAIILLLISSIIYCCRGFAYSLIKIIKGVVILLASIFLAKPLANILINLSLFANLENLIISGLESMGDVFVQPLPSGEELETIMMSLENLNVPSTLIEPLTDFINSLNSASLSGENLATLMGHGFMQFIAIGISFVIISLVLSIVFALILKIAKKINDKKVVGGVNRLLGFIFGLITCYIKIDILVYVLSIIMMFNGDVNSFISQTIYLESEGIFTLIKFIYNHNITGLIISTLLHK